MGPRETSLQGGQAPRRLLLAAAASVGVLSAHWVFQMSLFGGWSLIDLKVFLGGLALQIAAITIGAALFRLQGKLWSTALAWLAMLAVGLLLAAGLSRIITPGDMASWLFLTVVIPLLPALIVLFFDLGLGAFAVAFGLIVAVEGADWVDAMGRQDVADPRPRPDPELVYSAQADLMDATPIRTSDPDRVEMFALLGAGYPYEGVFRREVEAVRDILGDSYGAMDRVLSLVNDARDPVAFPLLNRTNLQTGLTRLAAAMGDEDIALLFLTSHGNPGAFSITFPPLIGTDLSPDDVDTALKEAGITKAVVILSACFSGSFAAPLANDDRLILTAAAPDRSSFGCNDQNAWTDWGRAFFLDALPDAGSFADAARRAQALVAEREAGAGLTPSLPMILEGANISAALAAWRRDLER